ncbi:MAG TPA: putative sulfate exporter family transporter [Gaiellaceae bacterium]|nr:putative sulfate exporter family transporter [Gaiellaceae bacterium]
MLRRLLPGVAAACAVTAVAYPLGRLVPLVGSPVLGLTLGIGVASVLRPSARLQPGLAFTGKYVLQGAIVALGSTLGLSKIASVGASTLPVMLGTLVAALLVAWLAGRALGIEERLRTLIGVGTGICGASAIAAVSGIVEATESEISYAISTLFVFNLVAVVTFPPLGHLMGLSQSAFGLWAGTAVNDTSSVVAAAYAYGHPAGAHAVVVKLTRTTMILPVAALLMVGARRRSAAARAPVEWKKIVPWFLLWFVAAAALHTSSALPSSLDSALGTLAIALITLALAAIGLSTRLGDLRRAGHRPLLLGALVWITVAATSLVLQHLTGS